MKKIKFLTARIDTCAEANIIQLSVYKLIFKDPDCEQLAPSTKVAVRTYTTDKINIVGSCSLFMVHPDIIILKQVTFYVTSQEGSVVLSCEKSLKLSLIHPHNNLYQIPDYASLICSNADHPMKRKSKKSTERYRSSASKWDNKANVYLEDDKTVKLICGQQSQ